MDNTFLSEYERLNNQGKQWVNAAINAAISNPTNLLETPETEILEIKRQQEEADRKRKLENERQDKYYGELKAECENMTKEDYITRLNDVFGKLPTYKLRYFYIFIMAKLGFDVEGGAVV